jgi:hypothetical protein
LNFVPKMDRQILIDGYKKIMRTIYSPAEYYERVRNSLKFTTSTGYSPAKAFKKEYILGFFRVLFRLGMADPSRKEFWRFLRRVYSERRELIGDAVVLAVMGYHFRKITEQYCEQ